jgi:hypothetical protein
MGHPADAQGAGPPFHEFRLCGCPILPAFCAGGWVLVNVNAAPAVRAALSIPDSISTALYLIASIRVDCNPHGSPPSGKERRKGGATAFWEPQRRMGQPPLPKSDPSGVKLWRVESERFSIQLATADEKLAKAYGVPVGTRSVVYIAVAPAKCSPE